MLDLQRVGGHGDLADSGRVNVGLLAQYVLLYLGAPFYHAFGKSILISQVFGAVLIFMTVRKAWQRVQAPRRHALEWGLLFYLAYIGGTALVTALGRSILFGLEQAAAGRYATPALMAWITLLVLHQPWLLRQLQNSQRSVVIPLVVLLVALTGVQWKALRSKDGEILERQVGALAMVMGVRDAERIGRTYYDVEGGIDIARRTAEAQRSVYARPLFAQVASVGRPAGPIPAATCRAGLIERTVVPQDSRYVRVDGWLAKPQALRDPSSVRVVTADGTVVGYAVISGERSGLAQATAGPPPDARVFRGYVRADDAPLPWTLDVLGTGCAGNPESAGLRVDAVARLDANASTVAAEQVLSHQGWDGSDFERSRVAGLQVLGSYVQGDMDTGSVRLQLRRGDRLLLRTGPTNARLRYQINGDKPSLGQVPLAQSWSAWVFDDPALPEQFELTLSDDGDGWGEWMAIAVQAKPGS